MQPIPAVRKSRLFLHSSPMAFHTKPSPAAHLSVAIILFALVSCFVVSLPSHVSRDGPPSTKIHDGVESSATYTADIDTETEEFAGRNDRRSRDEYPRSRRYQYHKEEEEDEGHEDRKRVERFVMDRSMSIIKTEAGEFRVLPRPGSKSFLSRNRLGLGFLSLEPKALLLPQYTDSDCLFIVYKGKGRFSWIDGNDLREMDVEQGDAYTIESGTVFHFYNVDEGQRFHVFSIHDSTFGQQVFQSYFLTGGHDPGSVLSRFEDGVLATAFNVSTDEVQDIFGSQSEEKIVFSIDKNGSRSAPLQRTFTGVYKYVIQLPTFQSHSENDAEHEVYNILKKNPDFSNEYGATAAADGNDFNRLKNVNKGIFSVRLKAGAVLAPHWNSRAAEIAIVTRGEGEIQIAHPNGSLAAMEKVREGMVFYVPKNFPMCQIASRSGPFEFIGFTTSSLPSRPQFLAGSNSVLRKLDAAVLAASFDLPVEHVQKFLERQKEAVVLPGLPVQLEEPLKSNYMTKPIV